MMSTRLTYLALSHCDFDVATTRAVTQVVNELPSLRCLRLSTSAFPGEAAVLLADALTHNHRVVDLDLDGCASYDQDASALARLIRGNSTLKKLYASSVKRLPSEQRKLVDALTENAALTQCRLGLDIWDDMTKATCAQPARLLSQRLANCRQALLALLGMRKHRRCESGLLGPAPRDMLRYVLAKCIWATREHPEWSV